MGQANYNLPLAYIHQFVGGCSLGWWGCGGGQPLHAIHWAYTMWSVQRGACSVECGLYTVCSVERAVCSVQYAVWRAVLQYGL